MRKADDADRAMPAAAHIMSYAQTLAGGGVERALLRLARGWVDAGRRVTLVIGSTHGPLAAELPPGVETVVLGSGRPSALLALPREVRRVSPDILFAPGNHYTGGAAWTRARLGRASPPIVAKVSNALVRADQPAMVAWGYRRWLRQHPRFLDRLVAMSESMRQEAIRTTGMAADRVVVIPNPPALPLAGAPRLALPADFVLGVGRLVPQKRWDRLLDAFARLDAPDLSLVILGEGPLREALQSQGEWLGLGGRLVLPGHSADPLPTMARARVVALTSDYEGVPGVLGEALAQGTPVVATESSVAVREIVSSSDLGSVVARDDPAALLAALTHWLTPGRPRPAPRAPTGAGSPAAYLALMDHVVASRR